MTALQYLRESWLSTITERTENSGATSPTSSATSSTPTADDMDPETVAAIWEDVLVRTFVWALKHPSEGWLIWPYAQIIVAVPIANYFTPIEICRSLESDSTTISRVAKHRCRPSGLCSMAQRGVHSRKEPSPTALSQPQIRLSQDGRRPRGGGAEGRERASGGGGNFE